MGDGGDGVPNIHRVVGWRTKEAGSPTCTGLWDGGRRGRGLQHAEGWGSPGGAAGARDEGNRPGWVRRQADDATATCERLGVNESASIAPPGQVTWVGVVLLLKGSSFRVRREGTQAWQEPSGTPRIAPWSTRTSCSCILHALAEVGWALHPGTL
eukprot:361735-Chlamydomonas_euryale.AAC.7